MHRRPPRTLPSKEGVGASGRPEVVRLSSRRALDPKPRGRITRPKAVGACPPRRGGGKGGVWCSWSCGQVLLGSSSFVCSADLSVGGGLLPQDRGPIQSLGPFPPNCARRVSVRLPVGDGARVERTDPAGVGLFGALVVGRDILYGVAVAASAGAAFAGHISSLHQHFGTYGRFRHC